MSQETRQVTIIANHQNDRVRFETNVETFGELKQQEEAQGLFDGNVRVIVREDKNELTMDEANLPRGSFTLIIVADKAKSGTDEYDEMSYHELRSECIDRGFDSDKYNGPGVTKNVMRAHLRDDDAQSEEQVDEDAEQLIEDMKEEIDEVIDESREKVRGIIQRYADCLSVDVIPDYSDEIEKIKRSLGL